MLSKPWVVHATDEARLKVKADGRDRRAKKSLQWKKDKEVRKRRRRQKENENERLGERLDESNKEVRGQSEAKRGKDDER